jgi:ribosome modulation factor
MLQSVDRLERLLEIATQEGISVRSEWLGGIRGGLVRVGRSPILFVDESLSVADQLEQVQNALAVLDWRESDWWDEIHHLLELGLS